MRTRSTTDWTGRYTRREVFSVVGGGLLFGALVACGGDTSSDKPEETTANDSGWASRFADYEAAEEPDGDLNKVTWPDFVVQAGPDVQTLYEFQVLNGELMRYMPCFCGCGASGYKNNRDCYIQRVESDGSVIFDAMAPT